MSVNEGEEQLTVDQIHSQSNRNQASMKRKFSSMSSNTNIKALQFPLALELTITSAMPNACDTH